MNQRKGHAERISDGSSTLSASSIWTNYNGLLVVGDVELDVFAEEVASVEVIDRDVEEALVLRVCR